MPPAKPLTADGYNEGHTLACERTLVTLLRGFGTLKHTLRLVGGLVPRYLTPARAPDVPPHAGTSDVDIVLNIQLLAEGEAYKTLAQQLKDRGFKRAVNEKGQASSWRWQRQVTAHEFVVVEFLRDANEALPAGDVSTVDNEKISALAIRHAGIVHEWFAEKEITAELLDGGGVATETVRFADEVSFIVLKALAFNDRHENKDAADLLHVMRYAGSLQAVAATFGARLAVGRHADAIEEALAVLERRFCDGEAVEGYLRDGPVSCARFLHGTDPSVEEERVREQRNASALMMEFLRLVRAAPKHP
ncbi:hypothetical protein QTI66_05715 [Variovorax sp. J22R133]|uniref:hypothetical protein n=1 Tax=Variovorax brevis TaxID=3053503 RepID=UPI002574FEC8|nr:hypothetical protein [Variovorax sp. J22R133]MDM0111636.1 hypothetical protein [Variovorax sp. J22R133]